MSLQHFDKKPEDITIEDILSFAGTYDWELAYPHVDIFELYCKIKAEQYLKWLDEELLDCEKSFGDSRVIAWRDALTAAKEKFLSLTQPQSIQQP